MQRELIIIKIKHETFIQILKIEHEKLIQTLKLNKIY
jgi:hypothetical protein